MAYACIVNMGVLMPTVVFTLWCMLLWEWKFRDMDIVIELHPSFYSQLKDDLSLINIITVCDTLDQILENFIKMLNFKSCSCMLALLLINWLPCTKGYYKKHHWSCTCLDWKQTQELGIILVLMFWSRKILFAYDINFEWQLQWCIEKGKRFFYTRNKCKNILLIE